MTISFNPIRQLRQAFGVIGYAVRASDEYSRASALPGIRGSGRLHGQCAFAVSRDIPL
ncbi:MAG: hypothetical protein ACOH2J_02575 [Allorhizobium sp.]